MPQGKKLNPAKAAWAWCDTIDIANITDDHMKTAYRLDMAKCKPSACRRNCRTNPYCISALGEMKWLTASADESDDEDMSLEVRKPNTYVGLKNLGATCYVNSLLQLWFHNSEFREAMFLWNPAEDPNESERLMAAQSNGVDTKISRSPVGHLQMLFVLMQFGKQKTLDPKDFIEALDLDSSMQQDAQEFSKLFITLLEDTLSHQSNPKVKDFISNNFRGKYSYITRCSKCQKESVTSSTFYELELNVKGNKSLHESLREFLKEEKMEGANMYSCSECMEKQEATRFIRLDELPPVLNLQLMRFIYDRQRGQKKKINSSIQFPDTLDMSEFVTNCEAPVTYNLSAVLIHRGPSAYSGHYIAHIRDKTTATWWKFNDADVEKVEGNKLKLNSGDDEEDGPKKTKQPRLAKGHQQSSNAYMLVYTKASTSCDVKPFTEEVLPELLVQDLKDRNKEYENMISESEEQKALMKVNGQAQKEEISTLWKALPVVDGSDDWEVLSTSWLSHWLTNAKGVVNPIDNNKLLCSHNKFSPDATKDAKYINLYAGESLYDKYNGGPRLKGLEALCKDCVTAKAKEIKMRNKIADDAKQISFLSKYPLNDSEPGFWVGKQSLKAWRKMAQAKYLTRDEEKPGTNGNEGDDSDSETHVNGKNSSNDVKDEESGMHASDDDSGKDATADGSVSPPCKKYVQTIECLGERGLRVVSQFGNITSSLADNPTPANDLLCMQSIPKCIQPLEDLHATEDGGTMAIDKNSASSRNRRNGKAADLSPTPSSPSKGCKRDKDGAIKVNGDITDADKEADYNIEEEFNEDLICSHGCLTLEDSARRLVSKEIWDKLKGYFPSCREFPRDTEPCSTCKYLASEGEVTKETYKQQAQSQREVLSTLLSSRGRPRFTSGTFHVVSVTQFLNPWRRFIRESGKMEPLYSLRSSTLVCIHGSLTINPHLQDDADKIAPVTKEEWDILSSLYIFEPEITFTYDTNGGIVSTSPPVCDECLAARMESEQQELLQYKTATVYIRQVTNPKPITASPPDENEARCPSPEKNKSSLTGAGDATPENIRRSTRHRRVRGEKAIKIASSDTLRDLKLKILNYFGVAPMDQHVVREDGEELTIDNATLSSLNIFPESVLLLKVDEPVDIDELSTPVDDRRRAQPEEGFKGTLLLKR